jgi:uncharacterized membrane protein
MKRKNVIVFFLSIPVLVVCEYLLLTEVSVNNQRTGVIIFASLGALISLVAIVVSFRKSAADIL